MSVSIRDTLNSACEGVTEVKLEVSYDEAEELKKALAVIQKYKDIAHTAFREKNHFDAEQSDFHKYEYTVKKNNILVFIQHGMLG